MASPVCIHPLERNSGIHVVISVLRLARRERISSFSFVAHEEKLILKQKEIAFLQPVSEIVAN